MSRWPILVGASLMVVACARSPSNTAGGSAPPTLCSRLHREIARQLGQADSCGPDVTQLLELTAVGNGFLLARRRFDPHDDLWQLTPRGLSYVSYQQQIAGEAMAALTLLPGPTPHVLVTDPRVPMWHIYSAAPPPAETYLVTPVDGTWPATGWKGRDDDERPWGHEFIGLEDGNVLDRDLGDGSMRVWQLDLLSGSAPVLTLRAELVGGPRDAFTRGHNLVYLSPGRLLEWAVPASANAPGVSAADCLGAAYAVWTYSLDAGGTARDPFDAVPHARGCWGDIGAGNDVLGDGQFLFVRDRATGVMRSYTVNPAYDNPLDETLLLDTRIAGSKEAEALKSPDWIPPTRSPTIKRLVLVLQDGRSFDSYFGRYCTGAAGPDGAPPTQVDGTDGCEAMPASIAGAPAGCVALDAAPAAAPNATPTCMNQKIAGGAMSGFATAPCGSPTDVVCAGAGRDAPYYDLVQNGALADRMFQTFAYFTGAPPPAFLPTDQENLLYLGNTHFNGDQSLQNTPFLTTELGRLYVEWTFYAGTNNLFQIIHAATSEPEFYDPSWYPYRSLPGGELERDIALGRLPFVSLVLPDATDPDRGEGPGHSPANGIAFVHHLVETIDESPYRDETLVLVTYLTAGGFFDHVRPPQALSGDIDATDETAAQPIPYGPRVPLLALGNFARKNYVAHEQLEMSSLAVFIEWNWLHSSVLKGGRQVADGRSGRDAVVNNIGSLLDPTMTGEPQVPIHHED